MAGLEAILGGDFCDFRMFFQMKWGCPRIERAIDLGRNRSIWVRFAPVSARCCDKSLTNCEGGGFRGGRLGRLEAFLDDDFCNFLIFSKERRGAPESKGPSILVGIVRFGCVLRVVSRDCAANP